MTTDRNQVDYYECVGITEDNQLYMVDYTFDDTLHGNLFCGATGSVFEALTQEQVDEFNSIEHLKDSYKEIWVESVQSGKTEDGFEGWLQSVIEDHRIHGDGAFIGQDTSYIDKIPDEIKEKYFPDAVTFQCTGGGRCFSPDMIFETIINQEVLDKALAMEAKSS